MQVKNLKESFHILKKNPLLYIPDVFMAGVTAILLYILYWYTGFQSLLPLLQSAEMASADLVKSFFTENMGRIIGAALVFFFVSFIVGAGTAIFKLSMIRDSILGRKISLWNSWREKRELFWPVVLLRVGGFLFALLAIVLVGIITLGTYFIILPFNETVALWSAVSLGVLSGLIIGIYLVLALLFRYPILFLNQMKHPVQTMQKSWLLLRERPRFVIGSAFVILSVASMFWVMIYILKILLGVWGAFLSSATIIVLVTSFSIIINQFLTITLDILVNIFLFLQLKKKDSKA